MPKKIIDLEALGYNNQRLTSLLQTQKETMPTASESYVGKTFQFIGETNDYYIRNYFYECIADTSTTPTTYKWRRINVQPNAGSSSGSIVEGYYNPDDALFYEDGAFTTPIEGAAETIYIDIKTNIEYRFEKILFIPLTNDIATPESNGISKPDDVTIFINNHGTLRGKVWAGTLADFTQIKDRLHPDTTVIIVDEDDSPISGDDDVYVNGVKIVTFADGTNAELAAMITGHDEGKINIYDYWKVGDKRTINVSSFTTPDGVTHDAGTANVYIFDTGYGTNNIHYVISSLRTGFGFKAAMNTTDTNSGAWGGSNLKSWLNTTLYNSIENGFKSLLCPFNVKTYYTANETVTSETTANNMIALPAWTEIWGTIDYNTYASKGWLYEQERDDLEQFAYCKQYMDDNNITKVNIVPPFGAQYRTPMPNSSTNFQELLSFLVAKPGSSASANGICVPFFCI